KREYIMERAKKLLEQIQGGDMETSELKDTIKSSAKVSRMQEYGIERLPAGDISGNELIVVEGRADVVNLLKNGISNVIAMNGIHLPNTVKELSREKEVILFIDGDRGGKLIAKNVTENARVAFIAVAPDGKEVEELAGKEILIALRKKVPVRDFFSSFRRSSDDTYNPRDSHKENAEISSSNYSNSSQDSSALSDDQKKKILSIAEEISGTRKAVALSKNLEILGEITISSISSAIRRLQDAHALIIPGTVTKPMIYAAEQAGIKHIAAKNFSSSDTSINLISI
ncbi:MAG: toprim domain-containing protein, partial [Nanoarchaeota archaeon]